MKDWKLRQKIFYSMNPESDFGDSLLKEKIIFEDQPHKIVQRALEYPLAAESELYYPGKSYAIAVIYAHLIAKKFKESFYEVLNDPMLLNADDPYFVPYTKNRNIYDQIIEKFPFHLLEKNSACGPHLQKTLEYFDMEFLLDEKGKTYVSADC